jgi:NADH-quinone oxidoreductase subunit M
MADQNYLLPALLLVPLIGAILGAFIHNGAHARHWALMVSTITFFISVILGVQFYRHGVQSFFPDAYEIASIGFAFRLHLDAVSLWLVILTTLLTPLSIAFSFGSITDREREYYAWMNALLLTMLGVFVSGDILLFYVFFELTLVPMFFIIGIWGGPQRRYAAAKFFLFTFAGSVFTLAAAIYVGVQAGTFSIFDSINASGHLDLGAVTLAQRSLSDAARWWVLLGFLAGFAVKVPLFPVHTWLPLAHTEAPTAGSVILAGVLLKLGTYGLFRLAVPIGLFSSTGVAFPGLVHAVGVFCVIGVIYAALVAWVQPDIKKLVAYSSVSHLGFCVLGLFALSDMGMQGSVLYMINHGLSTGAMFLVIGMVYDRYHTRDINELSGLARRMPVLAFFFVFFVMSSIGLPGLNGFWSEFVTILAAFNSPYLGPAYGATAALGIILGAIYMLHMTARVIFGPLKVPEVHGDEETSQAGHGSHAALPGDIGPREIGILIPIALVIVILGVKPGVVTDAMLEPIQQVRMPLMNNPTPPLADSRNVKQALASATQN